MLCFHFFFTSSHFINRGNNSGGGDVCVCVCLRERVLHIVYLSKRGQKVKS